MKTEVQVEALSNGKFQFSGPMFGGSKANLGLMACLRILNSSIKVVFGTERCQNLDQEFFCVVGIEPAEYAIICVKIAIHFFADYKQITKDIIFASSSGANPCELVKIADTRLRPGLRIAQKTA